MTSVYVFTTDWHIGSGTAYADNRLADQDDTLTQIARIAVDLNADAVLMGGDCYHKPHPSNEARTVVQRFCDSLAGEGIPMIAVHGNSGHDIEAVDRATALGLHASSYVNVSPAPELILAPSDLAVATLPSVQLGRLIAARDGGDRQEVFADATDLLLRTAEDLYAQVPEGWPSVLLGHWAADWPGMPVQVMDHGPVLPLAALDAIGFDMVLMGHIHVPQRVGNAISGGPPAHVSFGEAGLEHGCWVLTVGGPGDVEAEFVPLEDRRFLTVDVDLTQDSSGERAASHTQEEGPSLAYAWEGGPDDQGSGMAARTPSPSRQGERGLEVVADALEDGNTVDPLQTAGSVSRSGQSASSPLGALDETDLIAAEIAALNLTDAVLRIRYHATEAQHRRVDQGALKRLALDKGCHRVYQVVPDILRETRARAEGVDESLAPLEALSAWTRANDVDDASSSALAELTQTYLERAAA